MTELSKTYRNDEITIVWKPSLCIHSTRCWKGEQGLRSVFNPAEKPWIKAHGADTGAIVERIRNCPSGALSFYYNDKGPEDQAKAAPANNQTVEVLPNGPLLVHGPVQLKHKNNDTPLADKVTAFCRCGASANKPFCDGSHHRIGFRDE